METTDWLKRQFELAKREIAALPKWKRDLIRENAQPRDRDPAGKEDGNG